MPKDDMMTRGRGGGSIPPKSDDVIYEQPLIGRLIPIITQHIPQAINEAASQAAGGDNKNR